MIPRMIDGATRIVGKAQGYQSLPLRDEPITFDPPPLGADGEPVPQPVNQMATAWELMPDELLSLMLGGSVVVKILGISPPPMMVETVPRVHDKGADDAMYLAAELLREIAELDPREAHKAPEMAVAGIKALTEARATMLSGYVAVGAKREHVFFATVAPTVEECRRAITKNALIGLAKPARCRLEVVGEPV
jgi:hypothetical protein